MSPTSTPPPHLPRRTGGGPGLPPQEPPHLNLRDGVLPLQSGILLMCVSFYSFHGLIFLR